MSAHGAAESLRRNIAWMQKITDEDVNLVREALVVDLDVLDDATKDDLLAAANHLLATARASRETLQALAALPAETSGAAGRELTNLFHIARERTLQRLREIAGILAFFLESPERDDDDCGIDFSVPELDDAPVGLSVDWKSLDGLRD